MSTQRVRRPQRPNSSIAWLLLSLTGALSLTLHASACGSNDEKPSNEPQAGSAAAGSGGAAAGGTGGAGAKGEPQLGAACKRDADCSGGYLCDQEQKMSVAAPGAPGGTVDQFLFPGGSCTPKRATAYNPMNVSVSCDPTAPEGSQGCGDGICTSVARSTSAIIVGCRVSCDPSAAETGCRSGYQCGYTSEVCSEGCQSDVDCRLAPVDTDDDGVPDALGYDSASSVTCDSKTARCVHPAGSQASGQSCMRDDECTENGVCIPDGQTVAGQEFPGGYCTRQACKLSGHECDNGTTCESLRPWNGASTTEPLCFQGCKVGAESADLRIGEKGHGDKCREGYRCHYNGGPGADSGVCVGGNYNAVTKNNVGAECKTDAECYSPFGLGSCAIYRVSDTEILPGICTINDCAIPGLPTGVCGENNECVASNAGGDETNCQHHCKAASDCPTKFACTDDDDDPKTPKSCIPLCLTDADCRPMEKCIILMAGEAGGVCRLQ